MQREFPSESGMHLANFGKVVENRFRRRVEDWEWSPRFWRRKTYNREEDTGMNPILRVNKKDNVVTCLRALSKGESVEVEGKTITANVDIPVFHKMAVEAIAKGGVCYKYGEVIGDATSDIAPGDHVHLHNIESTRGRGDRRV
jgi:altronate dehydratase small subunit